VLRPLAEQVAAALRPTPELPLLDLLCDAGVLTRELARAAGPERVVYAVDTQPELASAAAAGLSSVRAVTLGSGALPVADGSCAGVGSLLTLGFEPDALARARPLLHSGGTMACAVWDPDDVPAHEEVLVRALREEAGYVSPFLRRVLEVPISDRRQAERIADVVRFDSEAQYWAALVTERPLGGELRGLPADAVAAVRRSAARSLSTFEAADGTLRIPVRALLLG
jgi:trans-aconitate methyltransferase